MNMENKIFKAMDKILWTDWDAIRRNDLHICRDEYRSHIPSIYELKVAGANCETIASRLFEVSEREIGIDLIMDFCRTVAKNNVYKLRGRLRLLCFNCDAEFAIKCSLNGDACAGSVQIHK
jgi:hypothetical protein